MKRLQASVIKSQEWHKLDTRDPGEWKRIRQQALQRDRYTCVYCHLTCQKFMQVNHIGAEDNHDLENLETICPACHDVQHMGISAMKGRLTVFECQPEINNMAAIVCVTRALVAKKQRWEEIENQVYLRFGVPNGKRYDNLQSIGIANSMLQSIPPQEMRGYLPKGLAIMFHADEPWNGYPEATWKWQCLPGSRYSKSE